VKAYLAGKVPLENTLFHVEGDCVKGDFRCWIEDLRQDPAPLPGKRVLRHGGNPDATKRVSGSRMGITPHYRGFIPIFPANPWCF
jgi:hypothetical protein